MKPKPLNKAELAQQCAGVTDPEQMGTSGLVAYMLVGVPFGKLDRWERFNRAAKIIRSRGQDVGLFCKAILATGQLYGINLSRFDRATAKWRNE